MGRWLIVTADGELELNATFHAVNLLPGDVDTNALWRQPGQRAYQRSGDGLRTPGPFILRGNVWRDDGDRDALRTQLQALTEATTTAATVVRLTPSAEYWYGALGGGPNPAITPDGLGGYQVELEFWPARPEPVTVPPSQFRARVSQRVPSSTYFGEVFTAPGPVVLNNPGSVIADLLGRNWALIVDRANGIVRLSGEGSDGEWIDTPVPGHPVIGSPTPGGARRFSLAFDQAATPVVAFEQAGTVKVTRWDASLGQYAQNVSFAGVDPVLAMDASWTFAVPDSDVLLFYLSPDRERVLARIQRDDYGTEYELHDYGAPVILDRVTALAYQYQLLVSDAAGSVLPGLLSAGYPVAVQAGTLGLSAEFIGGNLRDIVSRHELELGLRLSTEFVGGALNLPVVTYAPELGLQLTAEFAGGELRNVVNQHAVPAGTLKLSTEFVTGDLNVVATRIAPALGLQLAAELIGGVYEPG